MCTSRSRPEIVTRRRGFTMLELMIVLSVIAVLALMAIPNLQDKMVRDQIVEALPLADIVKAPVAAAWATGRTFPVDNAATSLPSADKIVNSFISAVTVREGAIDITFGNRAHGLIKGKIITLRPAVVEEAPVVPVSWICGYATAPDKMTIHGTNNTNIPAAYLPAKCRIG